VTQAKVQIIEEPKDTFREENIPGALKVELNPVEKEKIHKEKNDTVGVSKKEEENKKDDSSKDISEDYQLLRALDLMEGLSIAQAMEKNM